LRLRAREQPAALFPAKRKGDTAAIGLSEGVRTRARSVPIRVLHRLKPARLRVAQLSGALW